MSAAPEPIRPGRPTLRVVPSEQAEPERPVVPRLDADLLPAARVIAAAFPGSTVARLDHPAFTWQPKPAGECVRCAGQRVWPARDRLAHEWGLDGRPWHRFCWAVERGPVHVVSIGPAAGRHVDQGREAGGGDGP